MSVVTTRLLAMWMAVALLTTGCRKTLDDRAGAAPPPPAPAPIAGSAGRAADLEGTLQALYEQVNPAVVNIKVVSRRQAPAVSQVPFGLPFPFEQGPDGGARPQEQYSYGSGSGFLWDSAGHFVTNNHVVDGADKVSVVFSDGRELRAKVVGVDPDSDLAVIQVEGSVEGIQPVVMGSSSDVKVGELAVAIGNPFGLQGTLTVGFVSAVGRLFPVDPSAPSGSFSIPDMIQTDAPINPGNSGGVLLDRDGRVVGVPSAIISPAGSSAGIGFAITADIVKQVVPELIQNGRYPHPYLGFMGGDLNPDLAKASGLPEGQRGALVAEVVAGGPADKAGIRGGDKAFELDGMPTKVGGDVITKVNETAVTRFSDIISFLAREAKVGDTLTLTILRGGREETVKVKLEERPHREGAKPTQVAEETAAPRAYLGLVGGSLQQPVAEAMRLKPNQKGVLVVEIALGSPADKAGIRGCDRQASIGGQDLPIGGDVIVKIDGQDIATMEQLEAILAQRKPGDKLPLVVLREGKSTRLTVTLETAPR